MPPENKNNSVLLLPGISFFCPAYYDGGNLPKLIPAVHKFLTEITPIFEIIIIEDGSPDATAEVADQLAQKYGNTRVIHHKKIVDMVQPYVMDLKMRALNTLKNFFNLLPF